LFNYDQGSICCIGKKYPGGISADAIWGGGNVKREREKGELLKKRKGKEKLEMGNKRVK
jgi:hypothetical protein